MLKRAGSLAFILVTLFFFFVMPLRIVAANELTALPLDLNYDAQNQQRIDQFLKSNKGGVAVFDADGTLWADDVGEAFFRWLIAARKLKNVNYNQNIYAEYEKRVAQDKAAGYAWAVTMMAGLAESDVKRWAAEFFANNFMTRVYKPQRALISRLKRDGFKVWVISASNRWILQAASRYIGVDASQIIGIDLVVKNGVLTNQLHGPVTFREGKVKGIELYVKTRPLFAAGDSDGDQQMLEYASKLSVFIKHDPNQNDTMTALAKKDNWITQYFPLLQPWQANTNPAPQ
jgi:HAD superfamily phosphoserine phosphatase-like hydrolase